MSAASLQPQIQEDIQDASDDDDDDDLVVDLTRWRTMLPGPGVAAAAASREDSLSPPPARPAAQLIVPEARRQVAAIPSAGSSLAPAPPVACLRPGPSDVAADVAEPRFEDVRQARPVPPSLSASLGDVAAPPAAAAQAAATQRSASPRPHAASRKHRHGAAQRPQRSARFLSEGADPTAPAGSQHSPTASQVEAVAASLQQHAAGRLSRTARVLRWLSKLTGLSEAASLGLLLACMAAVVAYMTVRWAQAPVRGPAPTDASTCSSGEDKNFADDIEALRLELSSVKAVALTAWNNATAWSHGMDNSSSALLKELQSHTEEALLARRRLEGEFGALAMRVDAVERTVGGLSIAVDAVSSGVLGMLWRWFITLAATFSTSAIVVVGLLALRDPGLASLLERATPMLHDLLLKAGLLKDREQASIGSLGSQVSGARSSASLPAPPSVDATRDYVFQTPSREPDQPVAHQDRRLQSYVAGFETPPSAEKPSMSRSPSSSSGQGRRRSARLATATFEQELETVASGVFAVGDHVVAVADIVYCDAYNDYTISRGCRGEIMRMDPEGDARISFDGLGEVWVLASDLRQFQQEDDVAKIAAARAVSGGGLVAPLVEARFEERLRSLSEAFEERCSQLDETVRWQSDALARDVGELRGAVADLPKESSETPADTLLVQVETLLQEQQKHLREDLTQFVESRCSQLEVVSKERMNSLYALLDRLPGNPVVGRPNRPAAEDSAEVADVGVCLERQDRLETRVHDCEASWQQLRDGLQDVRLCSEDLRQSMGGVIQRLCDLEPRLQAQMTELAELRHLVLARDTDNVATAATMPVDSTCFLERLAQVAAAQDALAVTVQSLHAHCAASQGELADKATREALLVVERQVASVSANLEYMHADAGNLRHELSLLGSAFEASQHTVAERFDGLQRSLSEHMETVKVEASGRFEAIEGTLREQAAACAELAAAAAEQAASMSSEPAVAQLAARCQGLEEKLGQAEKMNQEAAFGLQEQGSILEHLQALTLARPSSPEAVRVPAQRTLSQVPGQLDFSPSKTSATATAVNNEAAPSPARTQQLAEKCRQLELELAQKADSLGRMQASLNNGSTSLATGLGSDLEVQQARLEEALRQKARFLAGVQSQLGKGAQRSSAAVVSKQAPDAPAERVRFQLPPETYDATEADSLASPKAGEGLLPHHDIAAVRRRLH
eukprot:TRINITY_DN12445_c0_g1_i2.p1 TRINITY_DN12445_c0_g1~~TRINITY_DN12445_c0_g1_i2.p1  ORF type:complete len:1197 (-),score=301.05 TRINITY_DN12445_c0_g1_i2:136-3726(-)